MHTIIKSGGLTKAGLLNNITSIIEPKDGIPVCRATIHKYSKVTGLVGCRNEYNNVDGISLSINSNNGNSPTVFIPLNELSKYSYHDILQKVIAYFSPFFIDTKSVSYTHYPALPPLIADSDAASNGYYEMDSLHKADNNRTFSSLKAAWEYARSEFKNSKKPIYSVVSISGQQNIYYLKIKTPNRKHYYINVNKDRLSWLNLKLTDFTGFLDLPDNTLLASATEIIAQLDIIDPKNVTIEKPFGRNIMGAVSYARKRERKNKKAS